MKILYVMPSTGNKETEYKILHLAIAMSQKEGMEPTVVFLRESPLAQVLSHHSVSYEIVKGFTGLSRYLQFNLFNVIHFCSNQRVYEIIKKSARKARLIEGVMEPLAVRPKNASSLYTIFDSSSLKKEWGNPLNTHVIEHGVEPRLVEFEASSSFTRMRYGLPNKKIIGTICRDTTELDLNLLIQLGKALANHKDPHLIVVASQLVDKTFLLKQIQSAKLQNYIQVKDYSEGLIGAFNVYFDSAKQLDLRMSILQCLAAHIPVVAPHTEYNQKLIEASKGGHIYNPNGSVELIRQYCIIASKNEGEINLPKEYLAKNIADQVILIYQNKELAPSELKETKIPPQAPPTTPSTNLVVSTKSLLEPEEKTYYIVPYSIHGGAEIYLINHIRLMDPSKVGVLFLVPGTQAQRELSDKYSCTVVSALTKLGNYIIRNKIKNVCFYNSKVVCSLLTRIKKIQPLHITEIVHSYMQWKDSMHGMDRFAIDRCVTVSKVVAHQWGLTHYEVIPPYIDEVRFSRIKRRKRPIATIGGDYVIGTVARFSQEKNLTRVVDIASKLDDRFKFIIVGQDGGTKVAVQKYIESKGLKNRVLLRNYNPKIELEYAAFDAFLLTSDIEGTPLTILEARASGIPVIVAPDVGAIGEMLEGVQGAYVFPPEESNATIAARLMQELNKVKPMELPPPAKAPPPAAKMPIGKKPLVSVYMPAYNAGPYIRRAIESVLAQTYSNIEICICDDGSTDNTSYVVRSNFSKNKNVKLISQPNKGIGAASNSALGACKGEIIAQLDADDWLEPTAIEKIVNVYRENPTIGAVYTDYNLVNASGDYLGLGWSYPEFNMKMMLHRNIVHPLRTFKKEAWTATSGFDESLENAVDYDMHLKLAEVTEYYHLQEPLYNYRQLSTSTTNAQNARQADNTRRVIERSLKRQKIPFQVVQASPSSFAMKLVYKPELIENLRKQLSIRIIAASDGAPHETWWGDYWAKKHLEDALKRLGYNIIPNLHYNRPNNQPPADIDLFCHASMEYLHLTARTKLAWVFTRHYKALEQLNYFRKFDHVFSLSRKGVKDWQNQSVSASFLPAGSALSQSNKVLTPKYDVLFVGNARGDRPMLAEALVRAEIGNMAIYGGGWDRYPKLNRQVKGRYHPNEAMGDLYAQAKIILNIHEEQMLKSEGVSIKAFDIMASGAFMLTDNLGVKEFAPSAIVFENLTDLIAKVKYYLEHADERNSIAQACTKESRAYTFDRIAQQIDATVQSLREKYEKSLI